MNFFEHQDQARKKTGLLVVLFALAVIVLIVMATILITLFLGYFNTDYDQVYSVASQFEQINLSDFYTGAVIVIAVVAGASLYKLAQLSAGGKVVAEMLGGDLVDGSTLDPDERKLLNIVEEMAIASGSPVPPVYVLPDTNINAFAAGFNFNDAVIGVTRGCIEQLSRDELQGVIAHEFSHIFHGDMRINIRLIGMLHGILIIGLIGKNLFRSLRYSSRSKNAGPIIGLAVGLLVIGFGGLFFGNLIKSAVSRQREYLADASAVKFTRNPDGIANALKKIGGFSGGAKLRGDHVGEMSHLFFGEAVSSFFATHPPLNDRIKRVQPSWNGEFIAINSQVNSAGEQNNDVENAQQQFAENLAMGFSAGSTAIESSVNQIGDYQAEHIAYAQALLKALPESWHKQAQTPKGSRALIYALLLDADDAEVLQKQCAQIKDADKEVLVLAQQLALISLDDRQRLPLIEIALPQLAKMPKEQFDSFSKLLVQLIGAENRTSLFEWVLYTVLMHYLKPLYGKLKQPKFKYKQLEKIAVHCATIFSILAISGHNNQQQREHAFSAAVEKSGLANINLLPISELGNKVMSEALQELNKLYPLVKPQFLKACVACICADGEITVTEGELIRAIADTIDCPMPPIVV